MPPPSPFARRQDVEKLLAESLTGAEETRVGEMLAFANALLRRESPGIDDRLASEELDPVLSRGVVVGAVLRGLETLRAGSNVASEEYPEVKTTYRDLPPMSSLIYFTDAELARVASDVADVAASGAFTIMPTPT